MYISTFQVYEVHDVLTNGSHVSHCNSARCNSYNSNVETLKSKRPLFVPLSESYVWNTTKDDKRKVKKTQLKFPSVPKQKKRSYDLANTKASEKLKRNWNMGRLEKVGSVEKSMDIPKIWNLGMELWKLRKSEETSNSAQPGRKLLMESFTANNNIYVLYSFLSINSCKALRIIHSRITTIRNVASFLGSKTNEPMETHTCHLAFECNEYVRKVPNKTAQFAPKYASEGFTSFI